MEFFGAQRVCDVFDGITQTMSEIVCWVNTPLFSKEDEDGEKVCVICIVLNKDQLHGRTYAKNTLNSEKEIYTLVKKFC